jgi:thymidylate kinase
MIVEFAGLPGSGKTTICRCLTAPHLTKTTIPVYQIRMRSAEAKIAWHLLMFCFSVRPLTLSLFLRGVNLWALLRCYRPWHQPVVLDQGLVHKTWSVMIDARSYSEARLRRLTASLAPFGPICLVWIDIPLNVAVERIAQRKLGRSRFDRLPIEEIQDRLSSNSGILEKLVALYQEITIIKVFRLNGERSPEENAQKIDALLRNDQTE